MDESIVEKNVLPASKDVSKLSIKKYFLIASYFTSVPIFLIFLILFSLSVKYQSDGFITRQEHKPKFQAVPENLSTGSIEVETHDGRISSLDDFFSSYESPLEGFAEKIISEADKNNIDYRLLPAIAMQESTLCKKVIEDSYNCWGFGIYGGKVTKFNNYNHAIEVVTKTLSEKYVQKGFVTPEEIVTKYTPSDTGKWAEVVSIIMSRLKNSI